MRRRYYLESPRWITARYRGTCCQCGKEIHPGDRAYWWPERGGGSIYCSECGQDAAADWNTHRFDERVPNYVL